MFTLLVSTYLGISASVIHLAAFGPQPIPQKAEAHQNGAQKPEVEVKKQPHVDLYCEELPKGAAARMGTIQFRHPPPTPRFKDFAGPPVMGVMFSPDGQVVATSLWERLRLWDANNGKLLFDIKNAELGRSGQPVFSPDGRLIAATLAQVTPDKPAEIYVLLWDAKTGTVRHRFPPNNGFGSEIRHVLFSPDGKLLALAHDKGTIHLWNTDTNKEVAVLASNPLNSAPFACVAFSSDGKTLVALPYQPRKIIRWDVTKGEVAKVVPLETLNTDTETRESKTGVYHDYLLSNDGRTLACRFFRDRIVHLLDTSTGKVRCQLQAQSAESIYRRAITPDGRSFAIMEITSDEHKSIVSLWDTDSGKLKHRLTLPSQARGELTFSPDGSRMTVGEGHIRLYDVATGNELLSKPSHEGQITSLAFTPDGTKIVSSSIDGTIGIWDAATARSRHLEQRHQGGATSLALVPGGSTFLSCGLDGLIRLHDWQTGKEIRRFEEKIPPGRPHHQFKELRVSIDGKTVIGNVYTAVADEPPFHSWDIATGKLLETLPKHGSAEFSDLTADGKYFIGVKYSTPQHYSYTLEVREVAEGRLQLASEEADSQSPVSIVTADGHLLITANTHMEHPKTGVRFDKLAIHLRELATGKDRLSIVSEGEPTACHFEKLTLSPDGRILATAKQDQTVQLWDVLSGKELQRFSGYGLSVHAMTFSPDGKFLATGHEEGTILVWDVSLARPKAAQVTRSANEIESYWKDLAGDDAVKAHAAIGSLVEAPEQAVALLKERLRAAADKSARIARLIAELGSEKFGVREAASKELKMFGSEAEPALRRVLGQNVSAEARHRINVILDRPPLLVDDPRVLREIRAVEVLAYIAPSGPETIRLAVMDLLKKLAAGAPDARLTQEANAALKRL
jgi:WD40 repeat protein